MRKRLVRLGGNEQTLQVICGWFVVQSSVVWGDGWMDSEEISIKPHR